MPLIIVLVSRTLLKLFRIEGEWYSSDDAEEDAEGDIACEETDGDISVFLTNEASSSFASNSTLSEEVLLVMSRAPATGG